MQLRRNELGALMKRITIFIFVSVAIAGLVVAARPAAAAQIVVAYSGECIDIPRQNTSDGTANTMLTGRFTG